MKNLELLIAAGFNRGHNGSSGADRTVSSLEWALANIGNSGTACAYADDAAGCLESRLIAAYAIKSLSKLKCGDIAGASREYQKAMALQSLVAKPDSSSDGAMTAQIEAVLYELERMFRQQPTMTARADVGAN
ncbi:MAG TPA: hypothetical protein V6C89_10465 [Drouetiella sp.]